MPDVNDLLKEEEIGSWCIFMASRHVSSPATQFSDVKEAYLHRKAAQHLPSYCHPQHDQRRCVFCFDHLDQLLTFSSASGKDEILNHLRRVKLWNDPADRVKVQTALQTTLGFSPSYASMHRLSIIRSSFRLLRRSFLWTTLTLCEVATWAFSPPTTKYASPSLLLFVGNEDDPRFLVQPWGYTPAECTVLGVPSITTNLSGAVIEMKCA